MSDSYYYRILSRCKMDCEYFIGNGNRHEKHLWGGTVEKHIETMKKIYNMFPDPLKPEWISMEDIIKYEKLMKG